MNINSASLAFFSRFIDKYANRPPEHAEKGDLRARHKFRYGESERKSAAPRSATSHPCIHLLLARPSLIYGVVRLVVRGRRPYASPSGGANDIDAPYFGEKTDGWQARKHAAVSILWVMAINVTEISLLAEAWWIKRATVLPKHSRKPAEKRSTVVMATQTRQLENKNPPAAAFPPFMCDGG